MTSVAQQQRQRSQQSVSREDLLSGRIPHINFPGVYLWDRDSWHETTRYAFAAQAGTCDQCHKAIESGEIVSLGGRYIEPDCCVPVRGLDTIHLRCTSEFEEEVKYAKATAVLLQEFYEKQGEKITQWDGWEALPQEKKIEYLSLCGVRIEDHHLQTQMPLEGCTFVITGSFTGMGEDHQKAIQSLGGRVISTVSKKSRATHILLGASGTSMYGQKTGVGSRKYRDAKKQKARVVKSEDFEQALKKWREEREWPAFSLMPAPASASSDMPAEASATTTTVTTSDAGEPLLPVTSAGAGDAEAATSAPTSAPEPAPASTPAEKATETEACRDDAELDASRLESLSRRELQSLAKKHRIKANKASCEIIRDLKRLRRAPEDEED